MREKKVAEAKSRAAELEARVKRAQQEAIGYQQGGRTGSPRDNVNAKIRAELLSAHAEADREYINLTDELRVLDARVEGLKNARLEDFQAPMDSEAVKKGVKTGLGVAVGVPFGAAVVVAGCLAPVILLLAGIASAFLGDAAGRGIQSGGIAVCFVVVCVIGAVAAILSSFEEARTNSRERARSAQIAAVEREVQERRSEHTHAIAELERKASELRRQLERAALSPAARKLLWERDNKSCYLCGNKIESWQGEYMHVDHLFPWSQGGGNDPENLRAT
ncbi:MAG: HNH endonuclease [Thermoguttaceae bacterium]